MKKNKLQFCFAICVVLLLSSCLGGDDNKIDEWNLSNCQIATFSLRNDSIPGLDGDNAKKVKFTIDQLNGQIYNKDSMPYGTVINRKLVCTVTYEAGASMVEVFQAATGDSINWNGKDSLDFSDIVRFEVYSVDGKAVKKYTVKLNVHQQNPDSMVWHRYSDRLTGKSIMDQKVILHNESYWMYLKSENSYELLECSVSDLSSWKPIVLTGLSEKDFVLSQMTVFDGFFYLPATDGTLFQSNDGISWQQMEHGPIVKALLGSVQVDSPQSKQSSFLAAIIKEGESSYFASMTNDKQWKTGKLLPSSFPVVGFANSSYLSMHYHRLMIVAGTDENKQPTKEAWETMDGLSWVRLTDDNQSFFEKREGASLARYDNHLYLIGGVNANNEALKDIYLSKNNGITWQQTDSLVRLPESFVGRSYSSIFVDKNNYLLLFSGKEKKDQNMLDELWCGRINRLGFKE